MQKGRTGTAIALILGGILLVLLVGYLVQSGGGEGEARRDRRADVPEAAQEVPTRVRTEVRTDAGAGVRPGAAPTVPVVSRGEPFARATWGSGPGQLARDRPEEANPEAPMSLAAGADGRLVVLDQVNDRLARFGPDGEPSGTTPLSIEEPQDIAIGADGTTAVLDRLVDRRVAILSPDGREIGSLPVEGEGIPEGGGVTAVIIDGDDVFLERESGPLVRIGDTAGHAADEREEVPGRPSRDGLSFIMAGLIEAPAGRFFVNSIERATRQHRFTRDIGVPLELHRIVLLDTDDTGTIYVAVTGTPFGAGEDVEQGRLLCLSKTDGTTLGSTTFPTNTDPDETRREMIVLGSGGVLYAMRSDEGVTFARFDCRNGAQP